MTQNRLRTAYRSLVKGKVFFFINLLGLAIGFTCALFVLLYLQDEWAYDRHHERGDRIYRLGAQYDISGQMDRYANVPRPIGPTLQQEYPEVLQYARIRPLNMNTHELMLISRRDQPQQQFPERRILAADSTLFDLFTFPFVAGNPREALNAPNKAILTQSMAKKLFGDENPLGKEISINHQDHYEVTGVVQDPPANAHFTFEVMVSWATFHTEADLEQWLGRHVFTYLLLTEDHDLAAFRAKWPAFYGRYMKATFDQINASFDLIVQPLYDIHLQSDLQWEFQANGNRMHLVFFAVAGFFILFIAGINYTNMATVQATKRATEVGIRKALGARRQDLTVQFLIESLMMAGLALAVSVMLVFLLLPVFNEVAGKAVRFRHLADPALVAGIVGITLVVGLLAGLYPASYLSGLAPIKALRVQKATGKQSALFRQGLTMVQFAISIVIIISMGVVENQMAYSQNKGLGFDKEQVMVVNLWGGFTEDRLAPFKNALLEHPDIRKAATSPNVLGEALNHTTFEIEVAPGEWIDQTFQFMEMDYDFIDLMEMDVVAGRAFNREVASDSMTAVMINEAAMRDYGWADPVGKRVRFQGEEEGFEVIGVVGDFHAGSLHHAIEPVVFFLADPEDGKLYVKLTGNNPAQTLTFVEKQWAAHEPDFPFDFAFLEASLAQLYQADRKLGQIFRYCAVVAILLACLGLLALTAFVTEQRAREIGIRKVLGASVANIVHLLSWQFLLLLLVANLVAWPVAYFLMNGWLENFAYRTTMSVGPFLLAGLLALLIGFAALGFQALRAAVANPVDVLRHE